MAMPADRNVTQKEAETELKYKSFRIQIQRMWNMECIIKPKIPEAIGILTKGLKKNLEAIPGKHSTDSLQKAANQGTSHITR